jgi:plasmid replication initiation protein
MKPMSTLSDTLAVYQKPGRMIRQPYRLTMASWNGTVYQKRILTAIIASLQRELAWVEHGMKLQDLPLPRDAEDRFIITLPLRSINPSGNNYQMVHRALECMEKQGIKMILPAVKGRKGPSIPEQLMLLKIKNLPSSDKTMLTISIDEHFLTELLRSTSGLSTLSMKIMSSLRSVYAMRLYEIISHWKDQESLKLTIDQLRSMLGSKDSLPQTKEFLRKVINVASQQLKQQADVYFQADKVYSGKRITHLNFRIIQRKEQKEQEQINLRLREQVTNILRIRFGWKQEYFQKITPMLENPDRLRLLNEQIGRLWHFVDHHPEEVRNIPNWSFSALVKDSVILSR